MMEQRDTYLKFINSLSFEFERLGRLHHDDVFLRRPLQPLVQLLLRLLVGHPHRLHLGADLSHLALLLNNLDGKLLVLKSKRWLECNQWRENALVPSFPWLGG